MSTSTITKTKVNTNAPIEADTLVVQAAGSTRCAVEGCGKWANASSRFCTERKINS